MAAIVMTDAGVALQVAEDGTAGVPPRWKESVTVPPRST
jgi:hypothetical protein